jgi:hypothetical protein
MPGGTDGLPRITPQDGYRLSVRRSVVAARGTIESTAGRVIGSSLGALLKKGRDAMTVEEGTRKRPHGPGQ